MLGEHEIPSHKQQGARFKSSIPRSLNHITLDQKMRDSNVIFLVLQALLKMKQQQHDINLRRLGKKKIRVPDGI